jgi:protein kinase-like protein/WD40 repeat protein
MALTIGTQLGSHEITALLGKGGMGEVYRARDLKLKRDVAIKVLPPEFYGDGERVQRLQREAEVLASLNHVHIGAIYDVLSFEGAPCLVLEFVEGETLADRIARGPIPVDQALAIELMTPDSKTLSDFSADGHFALYLNQDPKTGEDLWALPLSSPQTPVPVARTEFRERQGQFSPDVKWIAFQSNESGQFEIYVQAFPNAGTKTQMSINGGTQVRWSHDGKALFYIEPDEMLKEVPFRLNASGNIEPASPSSLFKTRVGLALESGGVQQYAVSADGNRFLMNVITREQTASPITVILNHR